MSAVDTRHLARDSLFLLATLRVDGRDGEHKVKVRNLSAGGMMLDSPLRLARGSRVAVELRNIGRVRGTVVWVQDNRSGIAFDEEIDPRLARAGQNSPPAGAELHTPRFLRPSTILPPGHVDPGKLRKI